MLITTVCTNCDATLKAPESVLGKRVKCTKCGKPFVAHLPSEDEEVRPAKTVKLKAPAPPPLKRRSDDDEEDDAAEESPPVKRKKPARRDDDDDDDTADREKSRSSRYDDDEDEDAPRPRAKKTGKKGKKKPAGTPVLLFVLIGIAALVLIGGGAVGVYYGFIKEDSKPTTTTQGPGGGPGAPVVPGGQQAATTAGWVEINEADGKYKVKFPTQPLAQNVQQKTPAGPVTLKRYLVGGQSEAFLSTHLPKPDRGDLTDDQMLDQAVQASQSQAPSKGATISNPKPITYQSLPGREFVMTLTGKKGSMVIRVILAADRIIILTADGDNATADSPRVKAFFESLKIE